jgi:hypothetical protein
LYRRFNGFIPPEKPCPLAVPQRFSSGKGPMLSWAFRPLRFALCLAHAVSFSLTA